MVFYYIIFVIFICFLIFYSIKLKKPKDDKDFFYNSYSLKAKNIFFTFSASWIGASSLILLTEEASARGWFSFFIIPLPTLLSLCILYFLRKKIIFDENFSIEKIIEKKYGRKFAIFSSFIFLWYLILLTSSQMVALGKVGESFLKIDYGIFLIFSSLVIILYSSLRGFKAVVFTDKYQLILVFAGIAFVLIFSIINGKINFGEIQILKTGFSFELLLITFSFSLAWSVSPVSFQRVKSSQDESEARKGIIISIIFLFVFFCILILLGISYRESIIDSNFPALVRMMVFLLLLGALFSTIDTMINSATLSFFYLNRKNNILSSFLVGLMSILIAIKIPSILITIGLSSEIIAEAIFIPVILCLIAPKFNYKLSGSLIMIIGTIFSLLSFSKKIFDFEFYYNWPNSVVLTFPLLLMVFMISFFIENRVKK